MTQVKSLIRGVIASILLFLVLPASAENKKTIEHIKKNYIEFLKPQETEIDPLLKSLWRVRLDKEKEFSNVIVEEIMLMYPLEKKIRLRRILQRFLLRDNGRTSIIMMKSI